MAKKEISGEEYKALQLQKNNSPNPLLKPIIGAAIVVVLCGLSFYGGISYQKKHPLNTSAAANGLRAAGGAARRGFGTRQGFTIGAVTAISSTSVSVNNTRTNAVVTLTIASNTAITNNGQPATTNDIKVGDTVLVQADSSNTSQAARIMLNPSFGGGNAPTQGSSNPST